MKPPPSLVHASLVVGRRGRGQDRCRVEEHQTGLLVCVADGAGGLGGGAEAADAVIAAKFPLEPRTPLSWESHLTALDHFITRSASMGETTGVVLSLSAGRVTGASVGDSIALLVESDRVLDLTAHQRRKPLLGTGLVSPVGFSAELGDATLLVATDGLHKYWKRESAIRILDGSNLAECCSQLLDSARLPNGDLQDDVCIVLARRRSSSSP